MRLMPARLGTGVIALAVFISAVAVVSVSHRNRQLFTQLQNLEAERDQMLVEWGQLQLEQSAWVSHDRVLDIAAHQLDMKTPDPAAIILVHPR